jgi:hypothetical protein
MHFEPRAGISRQSWESQPELGRCAKGYKSRDVSPNMTINSGGMSARPKLLRVAATGATCAAKLRRVVATGATCAAKLRRVVATMIYPRSRSDQADLAHMSMRFETFLAPAQKSGIPWQVRADPEQTRADSVQIMSDSWQTRAASGPPARHLGATSPPPRGHQSATSGPPGH